MKQSIVIPIIQGKNAIEFFLDEQTGRNPNHHQTPIHCFFVWVFGITLAIGLNGCIGPSKIEFMKQFDARIGQNKDKLITELGLPIRECTPLEFGEACEWEQIDGPPFLEGPLAKTFPGDALTYFLNSKRIVCQWRFQGRQNGTQQSKSQC